MTSRPTTPLVTTPATQAASGTLSPAGTPPRSSLAAAQSTAPPVIGVASKKE